MQRYLLAALAFCIPKLRVVLQRDAAAQELRGILELDYRGYPYITSRHGAQLCAIVAAYDRLQGK